MAFPQERSPSSETSGTHDDIQQDEFNVTSLESLTSGMTSETTPYKHVLPSPPGLIIGRDEEKTEVIDTLLQNLPARVAILGGAGKGKTTLVLSILQEDAVVRQYPSRYFVSCEGVLSVSSLVEKIANALRIPLAHRGASPLIHYIFSSFPEKTLLCLDNFETLWNNEAMRLDVEEFLSTLQQKVLGLVITMRGEQRPSKVSWSRPFLLPLQPLTDDISRRIFEAMVGNPVDEFVERLLIAADGIPLAISLISTLLQEGRESSESLLGRWEETRSGVLESGGNHYLSNLDSFIHLSMHSPRMRADPTTIEILAMLSVLPDGFPDDEKAIEELQDHLPAAYDLRDALLAMRQVSLLQLAQVDGAAVHRRLRILSPIRSFCQNTLEGSEELTNSITSFYVQKMDQFADVTDPEGQAIIPSELCNTHAVLMQAWRRGKGNASLAVASIRFTLWSIYLGNPVEEVVNAAMEGVVGHPDLQARCHVVVGELHLRQSKLDKAETSFKRAAELHREVHDVIGEGHDLMLLGDLHLRRSKLAEAEAVFERAAELHRQMHDVLGEGNNLQKLAGVYLRQFKLDEAETSFKRAAELHRLSHDALGEGNDFQSLAVLHLRRDRLDEAEESLKRALQLYQLAHNVLGQGNTLQELGGVHLRRDELDEARVMFERAAELHRQVHDILGEGNDFQKLGVVYLRRDEVDEAEVLFKRATELHQQAHDVVGEGNDLLNLGGVQLRRSELDAAEALIQRAIELYEQGHSVNGKANGVLKLGQVRLRRSQLGETNVLSGGAAELPL